ARSVDGRSRAVREKRVDPRRLDPGAGHAVLRPNPIASKLYPSTVSLNLSMSPWDVPPNAAFWQLTVGRAASGAPAFSKAANGDFEMSISERHHPNLTKSCPECASRADESLRCP